MIFEEFPGALLIQWNSCARIFTDVFQRSRDRGQIPSRLTTPDLQRAAAAKKSGKGGGVVVAGPALKFAPLDWFVLCVGKHQRTFALRACRCLQGKQENERGDKTKSGETNTPT